MYVYVQYVYLYNILNNYCVLSLSRKHVSQKHMPVCCSCPRIHSRPSASDTSEGEEKAKMFSRLLYILISLPSIHSMPFGYFYSRQLNEKLKFKSLSRG